MSAAARRIWLALALAATLPLAASPLRAGPPPDAPTSPDETYRAGRAHVEAGDRHFDAGEFRAAAEEYGAAYELLPLPDLLFNVAQSYRLAGETDAAIAYYRRYLAVAAAGPAADKAREHLAQLEASSDRRGAPVQPPVPLATPAPAAPARPRDTPRRRRWLGPVLTGAGLGLAVTGAALWWSAGRTFDRLDRECSPACDPSDWRGARNRERAGMALGVGGAAVAGAGVLVWSLLGRHDQAAGGAPPPTTAWLDVGSAGVAFAGRF